MRSPPLSPTMSEVNLNDVAAAAVHFIENNDYNLTSPSSSTMAEVDRENQDIADKIWEHYQVNNFVSAGRFISALEMTGLRTDDPRLRDTFSRLSEMRKSRHRASTSSLQQISDSNVNDDNESIKLDKKAFIELIGENIVLIGRALKNEFVIPEWTSHEGILSTDFCSEIQDLYLSAKANNGGKPADYIPQLARFDPNLWGVSVCTVDGQRVSFGDTEQHFCLQSCSKPLNYALVLNNLSPETVHQYVGQEPSGRSFNELSLNPNNRPHNPMINAGAIVTASLLKTDENLADRFDYVYEMYKRMAGGFYIGFSNSTERTDLTASDDNRLEALYEQWFLSERITADRNFALAYFMKENKCFPESAKIIDTLEFYFQLCSVEVNCESAAVIAATLANGGICPITGDKILNAEAVRNTLSLMHSCGMYDYSGQFAFKVGLPAKSGVSGLVMLVVPNVMGIAMWSPPLDELGNSCRGLQFCEELVRIYNFHQLDNLKHTPQKRDPRVREMDLQATTVVNLLFGAAHGDVSAMRRFHLQGMDMSQPDYDGRTAMHLAAAEGKLEVMQFLLEKCSVYHKPKDRWGFTPLDDAIRFKHQHIVSYLENFSKMAEDRAKQADEKRAKQSKTQTPPAASAAS